MTTIEIRENQRKQQEGQQQAIDVAVAAVNVPVTINVSGELLSGVLTSGLAGSMLRQWCEMVHLAQESTPPCIYVEDAPFLGGALRFDIFKEERHAVEGVEVKLLTLETLQAGMAHLIAHEPRIAAEILTRNYDEISGDALIQAAIFGKIIFG